MKTAVIVNLDTGKELVLGEVYNAHLERGYITLYQTVATRYFRADKFGIYFLLTG